MMLPVHFAPQATIDMQLGCHWLDDVQPVLGHALLAEIDYLATAISEILEMGEPACLGCRRAVLRRFDYVLAYRVLADRIEVLGLLHCRLLPLSRIEC